MQMYLNSFKTEHSENDVTESDLRFTATRWRPPSSVAAQQSQQQAPISLFMLMQQINSHKQACSAALCPPGFTPISFPPAPEHLAEDPKTPQEEPGRGLRVAAGTLEDHEEPAVWPQNWWLLQHQDP